MPRKFYTIFILPHAHARFRKIHISRNFVFATAVVAAIVVGLSLLAPHLMLRAKAQADYARALEEQNGKLKQENARFEASLSRIGDQVSAIESMAGRLAKVVGLKDRDLATLRPAGGGETALPSDSVSVQALFEEELSALENRAATLDKSFETLNSAVEDRLRLLAATPSSMPVQGGFSDSYGWRPDPFTGVREFHKGVDIVASTGTPVKATADGLVTAAGRMAGYGKMIHLSHGYGMGTRYGHLSAIAVKPGDRVKKGDVIGYVGSTGRSSGPHLHYEVFRAGRQVDPRAYLKDTLF